MMMSLPTKNLPKPISDQKGQTFLEFILIMLLLIGLSFGLIAGLNGAVGARWTALVKIISNPTSSEIELN